MNRQLPETGSEYRDVLKDLMKVKRPGYHEDL
jgi:hypothetical protein